MVSTDLQLHRDDESGRALAVQKVARYVAPPVAEEGAAQMIERIAFERGAE